MNSPRVVDSTADWPRNMLDVVDAFEFHRRMDGVKAEQARALKEREATLSTNEGCHQSLLAPAKRYSFGEANCDAGHAADTIDCPAPDSQPLTRSAPQEVLEEHAPSPAVTVKPSAPIMLPVSTPRYRNRVILDRGDGRQWTPLPTARELTQNGPMTRSGVKGYRGHGR